MSVKVFHGNVIYAESKDNIVVNDDSYIVVEDEFVKGIFKKLPKVYKNYEIIDFGDGLIIPAFSDLHIHGSQFGQRGYGMDKLLFDWLNDYTFPQESKYADMNYAKAMYNQLVRELIKHGTFHAAIFTTIHYEPLIICSG